eukprot:2572960-Rhodomonas_salina.3
MRRLSRRRIGLGCAEAGCGERKGGLRRVMPERARGVWAAPLLKRVLQTVTVIAPVPKVRKIIKHGDVSAWFVQDGAVCAAASASRLGPAASTSADDFPCVRPCRARSTSAALEMDPRFSIDAMFVSSSSAPSAPAGGRLLCKYSAVERGADGMCWHTWSGPPCVGLVSFTAHRSLKSLESL